MELHQRFVLLVVADDAVRSAARTVLEAEGFTAVEPTEPADPPECDRGALVAGAMITDRVQVANRVAARDPGVAVVLLAEGPTKPAAAIAVAAGVHQIPAALQIAETRRALRLSLEAVIAMRLVARPIGDESFRHDAWRAVIESEEQLLRGAHLVATVEAKLRSRYPLAVVRARRRPGTTPDSPLVWFCYREPDVA